VQAIGQAGSVGDHNGTFHTGCLKATKTAFSSKHISDHVADGFHCCYCYKNLLVRVYLTTNSMI
jgi:hypothetical protein